jgi:hypothetical protein
MTTHWQQGADWQIPAPAPEKGGKEKKQAPSNQAQWKPNSKAGQLVGYRADLWKLRTAYKPKLPHPLREVLTKQLPLKEKKKTGETPQPSGKTKAEPLVKHQHQDCMLKE